MGARPTGRVGSGRRSLGRLQRATFFGLLRSVLPCARSMGASTPPEHACRRPRADLAAMPGEGMGPVPSTRTLRAGLRTQGRSLAGATKSLFSRAPKLIPAWAGPEGQPQKRSKSWGTASPACCCHSKYLSPVLGKDELAALLWIEAAQVPLTRAPSPCQSSAKSMHAIHCNAQGGPHKKPSRYACDDGACVCA